MPIWLIGLWHESQAQVHRVVQIERGSVRRLIHEGLSSFQILSFIDWRLVEHRVVLSRLVTEDLVDRAIWGSPTVNIEVSWYDDVAWVWHRYIVARLIEDGGCVCIVIACLSKLHWHCVQGLDGRIFDQCARRLGEILMFHSNQLLKRGTTSFEWIGKKVGQVSFWADFRHLRATLPVWRRFLDTRNDTLFAITLPRLKGLFDSLLDFR